MEPIIDVKNLNITYKQENKIIVENADFKIYPGEHVLIDGKNGTGKSTLLKTLIGLEKSNKLISGQISILNEDVLKINDNELQTLRNKIAYLEQKDYYDSFYGLDIKYVMSDSLTSILGRKLNKADYIFIEDVFKKYMPENTKLTLKTKVSKLSGGQQRLLSIICNVCLRPAAKLYLIDEPLNNLDMETIVIISNLLNKLLIENPDAALLMVSHCKIFPFLNKILMIENNKIKILNEKPVCHACFGEFDKDGYYN